jgi:HD-GYP domain-containing protein (c-di-GMP phosphodiesterase class II)
MAEQNNKNEIRNKVEELIVSLSRAVQMSLMYGDEHRLTEEAIDRVYALLEEILAVKDEMTMGIIGDEIAFEKEPFYETSRKMKTFVEHLKDINVKKISFSKGLTRKEVAEFFSKVLTVKPKELNETKTIEKIFETTDIENITIGDIGFKKKIEKEGGGGGEEKFVNVEVKKDYQGGVEYLKKTFENIKGNQPLNVDSARQLVEGMLKDLLKHKNLLLMLTSVKSQDQNMFVHGVNVSIFTLMQAEALGLDEKYLADIGVASLLNNIGKLAKPGDDLWWEDASNEEAQQKRADQDVEGAKILLDTPGIGILAAIVAFEHNIPYDMSGPPKKLYGKDTLNLISMMIAISDYYDKLRSKPSYHEDGGPEKAYEEMMKLSGTRFHPDLLKNFFSLVGVYPPGTLVELDSKETGLVIQCSALDVKRPQVEILYDAKGERYDEPAIVNLLEKDKKGKFKWTIVKSVAPREDLEVPKKYS